MDATIARTSAEDMQPPGTGGRGRSSRRRGARGRGHVGRGGQQDMQPPGRGDSPRGRGARGRGRDRGEQKKADTFVKAKLMENSSNSDTSRSTADPEASFHVAEAVVEEEEISTVQEKDSSNSRTSRSTADPEASFHSADSEFDQSEKELQAVTTPTDTSPPPHPPPPQRGWKKALTGLNRNTTAYAQLLINPTQTFKNTVQKKAGFNFFFRVVRFHYAHVKL